MSAGKSKKMSEGIEQQPALPMDVPPRPGAEWRDHTAERWKERDPESYAECIYLIKTGVVNQSELARLFGKSRNSIQALMMSDEFERGEINRIIERAALIGTAQMQDKLMELTEKVKSTKDMGALAMATTTMHNIKQISAGGPTEIKEHRHRFSVEDFEEARRKRTLNIEPSTLNIECGESAVVDVVAECVKVANSES